MYNQIETNQTFHYKTDMALNEITAAIETINTNLENATRGLAETVQRVSNGEARIEALQIQITELTVNLAAQRTGQQELIEALPTPQQRCTSTES